MRGKSIHIWAAALAAALCGHTVLVVGAGSQPGEVVRTELVRGEQQREARAALAALRREEEEWPAAVTNDEYLPGPPLEKAQRYADQHLAAHGRRSGVAETGYAKRKPARPEQLEYG